jgi:dGTPase
VCDVIENSYGKDCIRLSREKGEALESLINENVRLIYRADKIMMYEKNAENTMEGLLFNLLEAIRDPEKMKDSDLKVYRKFYNFIQDIDYGDEDTDVQKVVDFVAGMTDSFALNCFDEIYWA